MQLLFFQFKVALDIHIVLASLWRRFYR